MVKSTKAVFLDRDGVLNKPILIKKKVMHQQNLKILDYIHTYQNFAKC